MIPADTPAQTEDARRTIEVVVRDDPQGQALLAQLHDAELSVAPSEVTIRPQPGAARAEVPDGPLDTVAVVTDDRGGHCGEILVWVDSGLLSSAEYAWVTDEPPTSWPDPGHVRVG
ncbi:MAG TPA: hypothetical protein VFV89_18540 [Nocardioides sp.]|uniref:hypothetical protein n=1 Tax=Nocardioides sp. TaxID=35761 RepID=UPI002E31B54D|nr:hypothetical protein [Nocardioides sp.]HEX5089812.1 hypothetical protein [Nocardioides sp.]